MTEKQDGQNLLVREAFTMKNINYKEGLWKVIMYLTMRQEMEEMERKVLPMLLETHAPLDQVVLMLGTNDCKTYNHASESHQKRIEN